MLAVIVLVAALSSPPAPAQSPSASPPPLTDSQRSAYERGQSYERVVLAGQDPKWYGVVLFRPIFAGDLDAFDSGKDFPDENDVRVSITDPLRAFMRSGDVTALPDSLGGSTFFDPYLNRQPKDPATWWFAEAGMADAEARAAGGNIAARAMAVIHPGWLGDHKALGGAYGALLGDTPHSFDDITRMQSKIEATFEGAVAPKPFVELQFPVGPIGYARIGMSLQTVSQMLDSPTLLAQSQSQAFVDVVLGEVRAVAGSKVPSDLITSYRNALIVDSNFDHDKAYQNGQRLLDSFIPSMSKSDQGCFFVGMLSTQAFYNAVIFKDTNYVGQDLGALAQFDQLDSLDPTVASLRKQLSSISRTDWAEQQRLSSALVQALQDTD